MLSAHGESRTVLSFQVSLFSYVTSQYAACAAEATTCLCMYAQQACLPTVQSLPDCNVCCFVIHLNLQQQRVHEMRKAAGQAGRQVKLRDCTVSNRPYAVLMCKLGRWRPMLGVRSTSLLVIWPLAENLYGVGDRCPLGDE